MKNLIILLSLLVNSVNDDLQVPYVDRQVLDPINESREKLGLDEIQWSEELSKVASLDVEAGWGATYIPTQSFEDFIKVLYSDSLKDPNIKFVGIGYTEASSDGIRRFEIRFSEKNPFFDYPIIDFPANVK